MARFRFDGCQNARVKVDTYVYMQCVLECSSLVYCSHIRSRKCVSLPPVPQIHQHILVHGDIRKKTTITVAGQDVEIEVRA
jgi:hypothetical protein